MAIRMLYTQYSRTHDKTGLSGASNAAPPSYDTTPQLTKAEKVTEKGTIVNGVAVTSDVPTTSSSASSSAESLAQSAPETNTRIAIFPQYLALTTTTLTIREVGFPQFSDSFSVTNTTTQQELFNIHRERPAIGWRQHITDSATNTPVMTVRRNLGQLPISYRCEDPAGVKVVDLQGNLSVPFSGFKSSAFLLNSVTGEKVELLMRANHRNRHATIKDKATGEVLVDMKSDVFEVRNVVGSRRTYEVVVRAGMDLAVAVALIVALDARAD